MPDTPETSPREDTEEHEGSGDSSHVIIHLSYPARKRRLGLVLVLLGAALLSIPLAMRIKGDLNQRNLERQWERAVSRQERLEKTHPPQAGSPLPFVLPAPPQVTDPEKRAHSAFPPTRISIRKIGLQAVVVEGTTSSALSKGPGHFLRTAKPGDVGNCCIAAHRNMYGSWFSKLNKLMPGDSITLSTPSADFVYAVKRTFKVLPDDVYVLDPTPDATLTLITCTPVPRPTHRLIVTAKLVETRYRSAKTSSSIL